ncbi:hypothetical protein QQ045_018052 [Rhodiola kirilowii]
MEDAQAFFLPPGISDRSPVLVSWGEERKITRNFRYCNSWETLQGYGEAVRSKWCEGIKCRNLFMFQAKLKRMKSMMKHSFVGSTRGMDKRVNAAREVLLEAQSNSERNPSDARNCEIERSLALEFRKLKYNQFLFNKQRTNAQWIKEGVNAAYIALIPKCGQASKPEDYRPISCYNVTYKIVASLLAGRLKEVLPDVINHAQGAFVKDRSIVGNICLAQQLLIGYSRRNISERITWKIDLRKAYDTIDWGFLTAMLANLKFPSKFIAWMKMCVQSTCYSIMINGEMCDFFEGKRGLRQGDPLSPFLFTIAMEGLSRMMQGLNKAEGFYYYPKCHRIKRSHIMFADDLIMFISGRNSAVEAMKGVVSKFLECSGLSINSQKSSLFTAGMCEGKVACVKGIISTKASPLPVRYLGLPLTSRSLSRKDCDVLIDKITSRLKCWSNRFLSRAGRRVLVSSVLQAMVFFWARVCILPKTVIQVVNAICARFLWRGNCDKKGGNLVKWEDVCREREEGGLGLKNIEMMNYAMVIGQMWGKKDSRSSLWQEWLDKYWSKGKHWWEVGVNSNNSWVLRRLAQCKDIGLRCVHITDNTARWKGHGDGFEVKDIYNTIIEHKEVVDWHNLVWNDFNAPRDSMNAWLVVNNKLLTRDRMSNWGYRGDKSCVLCESADESRDHLYFECSFTRDVWERVMRFLLAEAPGSQWELLIPWFKGLH